MVLLQSLWPRTSNLTQAYTWFALLQTEVPLYHWHPASVTCSQNLRICLLNPSSPLLAVNLHAHLVQEPGFMALTQPREPHCLLAYAGKASRSDIQVWLPPPPVIPLTLLWLFTGKIGKVEYNIVVKSNDYKILFSRFRIQLCQSTA